MSKIEVNEIDAQSGSTITVGSACKSVAVPGNVVKTNAVQASDAGNIISQSGTTITIGASGDTVSLASGASQSGFGRSGSVDWQTTPKTSTFTAASGEGYFINAGSSITANLPAGSAGAIVAFSDYARNFATYPLVISANGSEKIGGSTNDASLNVSGQAATFVYVDSTKGWINVQNAEDTEIGVNPYVAATGGTITESGDYKIHTFTGPGTFCVSSAGSASGYNKLDYLVVAGGGGAGGNNFHIQGGGGGGAGGFRESKNPAIAPAWTASPLASCASLNAAVGAIPVTIGAGGGSGKASPNPTYPPWPGAAGSSGSPSVFSTITSTGGGRGAQPANNPAAPSTGPGAGAAENGGSGGGESGANPGSGMGTGNTPPTTPPQGSSGGSGDTTNYTLGGGGGGATAVGGNAPADCSGTPGGAGATTSINASPVTYSAGGNSSKPVPTGAAGNASANTGNGGPANNYYPSPSGGSTPKYDGFNGGSGVVIIRYKFQN